MEIVVAYYLWVPTLVAAIIAGEFIDLLRKSLFPVPNTFRKFVFDHSSEGDDKSILSFTQYLSVWFDEGYNDPGKESTYQAIIRHPYIWIVAICLYLSYWAYEITNDLMVGIYLFIPSLTIATVLYSFREEIKNADIVKNNPIVGYFQKSTKSHFDLNCNNITLQNIREDCGFDEELNDPADLYFGLNMMVDGSSNTNTTDLRMIYQFTKNISLSLYICVFFLFISAIIGTVFQQLFFFLFFMVIIPLGVLYRFIISSLRIEDKYIQSLLLEYHISKQDSK